MDLFELNGRVVVNLTDAVKAFNEIQNEGQKTESKLGKFFSGVGKTAAAAGKAIATGLAAGATAMAGLTAKALSLGGELEQNMGGAESVFKELGSSIDKMSTTIITGYDKATGKAIKTTMSLEEASTSAYKNMGLSTSDYLATANKMGALFQGAGFETQEALDLSSSAMQRAADVASIMGIDTSAAMEAIAGAAKGNFTMMDNLGVAMNDTTLQAYALEKGIKKSTSEMTNQEKIGLAMEMFMEKTAYAAGNYAKENDTLAGSLGTAKSALTNFLDGSGDVDGLVDAFSNAANVIIENISTLAPRLIGGLTELVNKVIPMLPPLLNTLLPTIIEGAISLVNGLVQAMPVVIQGLLACLPALIDGFTQIMNAVISALPLLLQMLIAALPALIPALINGLVSMFHTLCKSINQIIMPLIDALPTIIIAIVDALIANLPALIEAGGYLLMGLLEGMINLISKIPYVLSQIFASIRNGICNLFGIHSPSTVMMEIGKNIIQGMINGIQNLLGKISEIWGKVKEITMNVWNGIKSSVSNVVNNVKTTISNVFNSVKSSVTNVWNGIKSAITKPIESARDTVKGIVDKIKGFFSGMKISFPKIALPHFSIKPKGWKIADLFQGSIPSLGIDWYAKAMKNPMLMTDPTVFGYDAATGRAKVGGEAGDEIVGGASTIMNMIRAAVADQNSAVAYYLQKLIDILASYFPQILESMERDVVLDSGAMVGAMVVPMNRALGKLSDRKDRGR